MIKWTFEHCEQWIHDFDRLTDAGRSHLMSVLNEKFPFNVYERHKAFRRRAIDNERRKRRRLDDVTQFYPPLVFPEVGREQPSLERCAVVLTAGGEGERLRLSLEARGYPPDALIDFTKAAFPLPGFYKDFGALQTNLTLINAIGRRYGVDIPVIVTTGPEGSTTARVIPGLIRRNHNFGLTHIRTVSQEERLHLTVEERIAWRPPNDRPSPITHPDETGGPIMSLKKTGPGMDSSPLEWAANLGCKRFLALQATALYNPELILAMAAADPDYDCVGVGIIRDRFEADDPFGTYVGIEYNGRRSVAIVEPAVRNLQTRTLKSRSENRYLPYNTGFYVFNGETPEKSDLPDYATPPKEVLPHLESSPKVGYAATDLIEQAANPAILAVPSEWFAVIKKADDLANLSELGRSFGLNTLCREMEI